MLFFPNRNFEQDLQRERTLEGSLKETTEQARGRAEQMNPRIMPRGGRPRSIEVQITGEGEVLLVNTDHGGHIAEWGSSKSPPLAVLRRAARAVGLRVEERGK